MPETKTAGDRRVQHVALLGLFLQAAAFGALVGISIWSDSHALAALARFVLFGIPIWIVLYLTLAQSRRVGLESLETQELRRARQTGTSQALFELDDEALLLEQNRLKWMVRWLLPGCTVLVSALLLLGNFLVWGWSLGEAFNMDAFHRTEQPTLMVPFVAGILGLCYMFGRWTLGAARTPGWELLRSGAVCMAGIVRTCLLVAIALMITVVTQVEGVEPLATYMIRLALIVLGLEFAVNFILDLYRPRSLGELPRPSFDSRLLGMAAEPGDIAKSMAEAFNYQFGFQVSSTWFYQLLQRWLFPLMVVSFAAVLMLTSVVVVDADEQVAVERFGRRLEGQASILPPGIHFKWPYPIDVVYRAPVKRISELVIGEPIEEEDAERHADEAVVWTHEHGKFVAELMLLVAAPKDEDESSGPQGTSQESRMDSGVKESGTAASDTGESVPVSLLMVSVPIEYRIKDIHSYLYTYQDPKRLLENVAQQYLSDYAASVHLDELIGPGRMRFNREIKRVLQERLDDSGVGIEIAFAGIRGAHPPAQAGVAEAFHGKISAVTGKAATITAAEGEHRRILVSAVGTERRALALDEAIREKRALNPGSPEFEKARKGVEDLLLGDPEQGTHPASGEAAKLIAEARARATRKISNAAAKVQIFGTQVAAFLAAPELYKQRKALEIYEDLNHIRKYLIVGDRSNIIIEYETTKEAGLDQVLSEGVQRERKKRDERERQRNP